MATNAKSLYVAALRNTHALESQGLQQMESQVGGLENYPEYARLLRDHIEVTRRQLKRLEDALGALGESTSSFKEAVTNTAGRIGAAVHALAQDETLKNLYAGYGYQYDQIAATARWWCSPRRPAKRTTSPASSRRSRTRSARRRASTG